MKVKKRVNERMTRRIKIGHGIDAYRALSIRSGHMKDESHAQIWDLNNKRSVCGHVHNLKDLITWNSEENISKHLVCPICDESSKGISHIIPDINKRRDLWIANQTGDEKKLLSILHEIAVKRPHEEGEGEGEKGEEEEEEDVNKKKKQKGGNEMEEMSEEMKKMMRGGEQSVEVEMENLQLNEQIDNLVRFLDSDFGFDLIFYFMGRPTTEDITTFASIIRSNKRVMEIFNSRGLMIFFYRKSMDIFPPYFYRFINQYGEKNFSFVTKESSHTSLKTNATSQLYKMDEANQSIQWDNYIENLEPLDIDFRVWDSPYWYSQYFGYYRYFKYIESVLNSSVSNEDAFEDNLYEIECQPLFHSKTEGGVTDSYNGFSDSYGIDNLEVFIIPTNIRSAIDRFDTLAIELPGIHATEDYETWIRQPPSNVEDADTVEKELKANSERRKTQEIENKLGANYVHQRIGDVKEKRKLFILRDIGKRITTLIGLESLIALAQPYEMTPEQKKEDEELMGRGKKKIDRRRSVSRKLETLQINNAYNVSFPMEISHDDFPLLRKLFLTNGNLIEIPIWVSKLPALDSIIIQNSRINYKSKQYKADGYSDLDVPLSTMIGGLDRLPKNLIHIRLIGCGLTHDIQGTYKGIELDSLFGYEGTKLFDLSFNPLDGLLPSRLHLMTSITKLNLNGCGLKIIPDEIGSLTELKKLELSYNELLIWYTRTPKGGSNKNLEILRKLPKLIVLRLTNNGFKRIPPGLVTLTNLLLLDLSDNDILGLYIDKPGTNAELSRDVSKYLKINNNIPDIDQVDPEDVTDIDLANRRIDLSGNRNLEEIQNCVRKGLALVDINEPYTDCLAVIEVDGDGNLIDKVTDFEFDLYLGDVSFTMKESKKQESEEEESEGNEVEVESEGEEEEGEEEIEGEEESEGEQEESEGEEEEEGEESE
jgi:Leucine-rich repeat (LRR) protein